MKREKIRVLARLAVFLMPLLCLCAVLSRVHERMTIVPRPPIPAGTRILILGDSHATDSLDPQRLGRACNFGSDGESFIHNYYKLRYAADHTPSLRVVILPADLHSFSAFRSNRVQVNAEWARYVDYLELGRLKGKWPHYARELIALRLFGFLGEYQRFISRWFLGRGGPAVARIDRGFTPRSGFFIKKGRKQRGRKRARRQLEGVAHFSPDMVLYFHRILDLARRRGLAVVLIRFPVTQEYLQVAETLMPIEDYYARIRAIAAAHPRVHLLDRHDVLQVPPGRYFRDAQHLNVDGAARFSDLIRGDLKKLGLLDPEVPIQQ